MNDKDNINTNRLRINPVYMSGHTVVQETWDLGDFSRWHLMGPGTKLTRECFVRVDGPGIFTTKPEFIGQYTRAGRISLSLNVGLHQRLDTKPCLGLRHDSSSNTWYYDLPYTEGSSWQDYTVSFDPQWTDEQAILNAWKKDGNGFYKSWKDTLAHVYALKIYLYYDLYTGQQAVPQETGYEISIGKLAIFR